MGTDSGSGRTVGTGRVAEPAYLDAGFGPVVCGRVVDDVVQAWAGGLVYFHAQSSVEVADIGAVDEDGSMVGENVPRIRQWAPA